MANTFLTAKEVLESIVATADGAMARDLKLHPERTVEERQDLRGRCVVRLAAVFLGPGPKRVAE